MATAIIGLFSSWNRTGRRVRQEPALSSRHAPRCHDVNAVLLAAGYGIRIRSLFPDTPKALIEVGGRALIDHLLANLARSGAVQSALVVTNDRYHDALRRHLTAGAPPLPTSVISDGTASEEERLGALGDLQLALRRLDRGGDVLVAATDKLLAFELAEPLRFARERAAPVTLCVRMPDRRRLAGRHGCVLLDAAGRIVDFEEKPERPKSNIASLAVYVLTTAAQDLLDDYLRGGGNRDAPGHFLSWLTRATTVYGYLTAGDAYDVGTPESYAEAQRASRTMLDRSPG